MTSPNKTKISKEELVDLVVDLRILEKSTTDESTREELNELCERLKKRIESYSSSKNVWPHLRLTQIHQEPLCEVCHFEKKSMIACYRTQCPAKVSFDCGA